MCVVSMVYDHFYDKWRQPPYTIPILPFVPYIPAISTSEIEEFRKLLERAREYDKRNNEPDCELEEKRKRLKDLAKELGVDISFV